MKRTYQINLVKNGHKYTTINIESYEDYCKTLERTLRSKTYHIFFAECVTADTILKQCNLMED